MRKMMVIAWAVLMLPACVVKVDGLVMQKDFRSPAISQGGVLVGGVIGAPGQFDLQQSNDLSDLMRVSLMSKRKYLRISGPSALFNAMGEAKYLEMMNAFATADLTPEALAAIAPAMNGVRYLALAKVDSDTTRVSRSETPPQSYKDQGSGKLVFEAGKVRCTHARTVAITMTFYDLETGTVAFSGHYDRTEDRNAEFEQQAVPPGLLESLLLGSRAQSTPWPLTAYPVPDPPTTREVAEWSFLVFGENLPEAEKGQPEIEAEKARAAVLE